MAEPTPMTPEARALILDQLDAAMRDYTCHQGDAQVALIDITRACTCCEECACVDPDDRDVDGLRAEAAVHAQLASAAATMAQAMATLLASNQL